MHRRADFKTSDPAFTRPILISGIDDIRVEAADPAQQGKELAS